MRRLAVLGLALALFVAACGGDTGATTTTATTPTTLAGPGGLPREIADLVAETERLRGLTFLEDPIVTVVSADEMERRVRQSITEALPEDAAAAYQTLYELLGLLDGTVDLITAFQDMYSEQVAGFYDEGELVVAADSGLTPLARSVLVHELVHALTDQHFGFVAAIDELTDAGLYDEALAMHALAEGDATYFQLLYLQGLPVADQIAALQESLEADTTVVDSLPSWFAEDLTFPYDAGFRFVVRLVARGGIEMVDQAYRLPPSGTEQILDPERFFTMEPGRPVELPDVDLAGYEAFDEGTFGAWNMGLYLLDGISDGDKAVATGGWGGDGFRLYWDGSRVAFAYVYEADTPRDAEELASALRLAVSRRMALGGGRPAGEGMTIFDAGPGYAHVRAGERRVVFVAANDPGVGASLAGSLATSVLSP